MERGILFEPDFSRLRTARNLVHKILHPKNLQAHRPILDKHTKKFLGNLVADPEGFAQHIRR